MFSRILRWTIVAVFFLIFVGSVVRSTGSGMGCPDWPKCFNSYIPPTSAENLPADYASFYTESRIRKNEKLKRLFVFFGLEDVLKGQKEGHSTYDDIMYDSKKAWIEYLNRIVGVVVGFLVLGVFLVSFKYLKSRTRYVVISTVSLILLLIQAYLGSVVVSTNLLPGMISVHMLLAVLLLFLLLYLMFDVEKDHQVVTLSYAPRLVFFYSVLVIVFSFVQMFLGINVRELVDTAHHSGISNNGIVEYISSMSNSFYIHRSFSLAVIGFNVLLVYLQVRYGVNNKYSQLILPIIVAEVCAGVALGYFDLTPIAQPFHLLFATLLLGTQFLNFLSIKFALK